MNVPMGLKEKKKKTFCSSLKILQIVIITDDSVAEFRYVLPWFSASTRCNHF